MPYVARVLRGAALKERSQPYVAALEVQGASATAICLRHIVPNIAPLIVAQATIMFGYAMVDLAADLVPRARRAAAGGRTGA